jgi:hypothetical protein
MLDPTYSDVDRLCRDSFVRKLLQQELAGPETGRPSDAVRSQAGESSDQKPVLIYVPCRIRFTLLAQLTSRMTWGVSSLRASSHSMGTPQTQGQSRGQSGLPQEAYSVITGHHANPLAIGSDHAVARLVSSTLWLSVEAARCVWGFARDGEAQCILHEAKQRHLAYHKCSAQGQRTHAYRHAMVNSLLTQNYRLSASLYQSFSGACFQLRRLIETMDLCRHCILSDNTTFDVTAVAMTLVLHTCLGFRLLLTSPQIAHLRGGCAYLLKGVKRLEMLLQLAPVDLLTASSALPRVLAVAIDGGETQSQAGRDNSTQSRFTVPTSGAAYPVRPSQPAPSSAGEGPARPRAKPEERDFEAGLAVGIGRALAAEQWAAARRVPFEAPPPPLGSSQLPQAQTANNAAPAAAGVASKAVSVAASTGEIQFRRALAQPACTEACAVLLQELSGMAHGLLFVLEEDLHANFPEVDECMSQKPEAVVEREHVPAAAMGLGLRAGASRGAVGDPAVLYKSPAMVTAMDALDCALGRGCEYLSGCVTSLGVL